MFSPSRLQFLLRPDRLSTTCRLVSQKYSTKSQNPIENERPGEVKVGWTTIYRFPYIGIVSALNRTKWYQLGATVLGCPFAYAMELTGEVSPGTAIICAAVGLSATVATTAFSRLSSGTVGFFYLNDDNSQTRFGYVDSNGKRQDVVAGVDGVQSKGENKFFIRIAVASGGKKTNLKLFHNHGIISDVGKFNQVL